MNAGLHLTKIILQIYSTTKETYLRRKERPFTYMPQFIEPILRGDCLPLTFSYLSVSIVRKKSYILLKIYQFCLCRFSLLVPRPNLIYDFHRFNCKIPYLEVPRFEQFSTLPLTWIGAFVRNPILRDRLEQCLYLRIISVLLARTLPFVWAFYISLYRTSKVKTYPSLLSYSFMAIIPQPYGIRVYH